MPQLNGTGPEGKGAGTGRALGRCKKNSFQDLLVRLGKGMGMRRKKGGGKGQGKRTNA